MFSKEEYYDIDNVSEKCRCNEILRDCEIHDMLKCAYNVENNILNFLSVHNWDNEMSYKFLKIRHNIFAEAFLSDNSIGSCETDCNLRRMGYDSDLTPDIHLKDNVFIEFFVSSNSDFALQNKISKYSRVEGIEMIYFYYDTRERQFVCSTDSIEYKIGFNLRRFQLFFDSKYNMMRYVRLDSSDLYCPQITTGSTFGTKQRTVKYMKVYEEFTIDEFSYQIRRIKDHLTDMDDEDSYDLVFDCDSRKFSISRGGVRWPILYDNINSLDFCRRIVKYMNFEVKEVDVGYENVEKISSGEYNLGEGHTVNIVESESYESCLEYPMKTEDIFDGINSIDFDGLYKNVLDTKAVKEISKQFKEEWIQQCRSYPSYKVKMITMFPLMDPVRAMQDVDGMIKFSRNLNNILFRASTYKGYVPPKTTITESEEKEYILNKEKIDQTLAVLKAFRREWAKVSGVNKMSYDIKIINDKVKSVIKNKNLKKENERIEELVKSVEPMGEMAVKYATECLNKERMFRKNRRISKKRIFRDNTIYLDSKAYILSQSEKKIIKNNENQDRGEEVMGLMGYSGEIKFSDLEKMIQDSWDYLCGEIQPNEWYDTEITGLSFPKNRVGEETMQYYMKHKMIYDKLKRTRLYWILCLLSNLAKSIWAISTFKTKKRAVVFDKFGTKSCFVFCNGTGTIQKFKSSKAFKIMIPINAVLERLCGHSSSRCGDIGLDNSNKKFFMSHWMYLKVDHLKYFMELPMRWIQIMSCCMTEYGISDSRSEIFMILTMNMLNARRKTENLLHDMKYLTYNMFGVVGCYNDLLRDKFEVPKDMWMRYLEEKFLIGIPDFIDSLEDNSILNIEQNSGYPTYRIRHPLSHHNESLDIFNLYVYSSYVFPKGVFTQYSEQMVNMSGILEIHKKAMLVLDGSRSYSDVKEKTDKPIREIFDNDLYYNSGVASAIGVFAEAELMTFDSGVNLRSMWCKIVNTDITEYANSHGLRGYDLSKKVNWGKKGHDIMTRYIADNASHELIDEMWKITLPNNIYDAKKLKNKIELTKFTVAKFGAMNKITDIQLNNANKVQWGGSREIYIMTFGAKNVQWALEQMFKEISTMISNELIHIPASTRLAKLYGAVKKRQQGVRYYLTLDCRKWAPLSNINKYIVFLNSMSGILPREFLSDFNRFFELYFNKKLFFKKDDVESFLTPERNKEYFEFFKLSGDAYYIEMPYSFMMGMFNYLSSVYHAMTQRFFIKEIIPYIERKWKCQIYMEMYAHSDDSGGFIEIMNTSEYSLVMLDVLRQYEAFQKCNNHMLSLKKCVVSNSYFEITSYCFMKTDPMPVLAKFIYNHQINLTASGYISDVKSISSDVTEMVMNGSSFQCAFIKYLCLGESYRKHCLGQSLNDITSRISWDLIGFPMVHPYYIVAYKSSSEQTWLSSLSSELWRKNKAYMESIGTLGQCGEKRGLPVHMITFKSRSDDGRFAKFEQYPEIPDDIIPSGHYFCYMKKMSSRYFRDSMWYSLHDIDGTILQSNMFNNGLCQAYYVNGKFYGIKMLANFIQVTLVDEIAEDDVPRAKPSDTYVRQIEDYIRINKDCVYKPSQARPKPCVVSTYYSRWWRRNQKDIKSSVLAILCPWMCLIASESRDIPMLLSNINSCPISELMNSILEEDPLMRIDTLTRSTARNIDRYDILGSWFFTNSLPMMTPDKLKRPLMYYSQPDKNTHPECIASFLFEFYQNGNNDVDVSSLELVKYDEKMNIETKFSAIEWLRKIVISEDPMVRLVISKSPGSWMDEIGFVAIRQNQAAYKGKYWMGRTTLFFRVNSREYELTVSGGKIIKTICAEEYPIEKIRYDIETLAVYGFDANFNISKNKFRHVNRITVDVMGVWSWNSLPTGTEYYDNIMVDPRVSYRGKISFKKNSEINEDSPVQDIIGHYRKRMFLNIGGNQYRCYLTSRKPCESCMAKLRVNNKKVTGTVKQYNCIYTKTEIIENMKNTRLYNLMHKYYTKNFYMIPDRSRYMCSPGSILSYIYTKNLDSNIISYMIDYKNIFSSNAMSESQYDIETITTLKNKMREFVKLRVISGKVVIECDDMKMNKILEEEGLMTVCTALALMPLTRTIMYYSPMTSNMHWYSNTEAVPQFIKDTLSYVSSTLEIQSGKMEDKRRLFHSLIDEIIRWETVVYAMNVRFESKWRETIDYKLYSILRKFSDVGEPDDPEISENFYYDVASILGSMQGFLRYLMCYSYRRNGKLQDGYKQGYKDLHMAFCKRYRTYVKDKFGYSIRQPDHTRVKILSCPEYEKMLDTEEKFYPKRGCPSYDYYDDEECFDDETMTYDIDEAMMSWDYIKGDDYDYANEQVFMEEGETTTTSIFDPEEACHYRVDDKSKSWRLIYEMDSGLPNISVKNNMFIFSNSRFMGSENIMDKLMEGLVENSEEPRVIDHLASQLDKNAYNKGISSQILKVDDKTQTYVVSNEGILGVMNKTMILNQIGAKGDDISPLIEGEEAMERIGDDTEKMGWDNLDERAVAELEKLCPDLVRMMTTHTFRLTETTYEEILNSYYNAKFKSGQCKWIYLSVLNSVSIVTNPDMMTEKALKMVVQLRKDMSTNQNGNTDDQIPEPGMMNPNEFTIEYVDN